MSPSESQSETLISGCGETITIEEVPTEFTESGVGWLLEDSDTGAQVPLHVDDVPELITMLEAFHEQLQERDDVDVTTTLSSDSSIRISPEE